MKIKKTSHNAAVPQKKMVFIHVAKAAGTSVKGVLSEQFASDRSDVALERRPEWIKYGRLDGIEQLQFLSGHISYAQLEERVDLSRFVVVTCIRNPLEHIVSHIAHVRSLADKKCRKGFDASSQEIQLLALKLAKLDLASPAVITELYKNITKHELLLFDNTQTRYFTKHFNMGLTGQRIGAREMELALQTLQKIDLVGDIQELRAFLRAVSLRMGWNLPDQLPRRNSNNEKYGINIHNPAMVKALWPFIHYDMVLYSQRAKFRCASDIS